MVNWLIFSQIFPDSKEGLEVDIKLVPSMTRIFDFRADTNPVAIGPQENWQTSKDSKGFVWRVPEKNPNFGESAIESDRCKDLTADYPMEKRR